MTLEPIDSVWKSPRVEGLETVKDKIFKFGDNCEIMKSSSALCTHYNKSEEKIAFSLQISLAQLASVPQN